MYKIILVVVFAFSILLFWIQQLQSSPKTPVAVHPIVKPSHLALQSNSATAIATANKWNAALHADSNQPVQLFKPLSKEQAARDAHFIFAQRLQQEDSYPITYAEHVIAQRQVGDQVQFQVPQLGLNLVGTVDKTAAVDQDIHRWSGRIENSPENSTFSILQSAKDRYAIVQLHTAQGLYVAEIKNGLGVVQPDRVDLDHDQ